MSCAHTFTPTYSYTEKYGFQAVADALELRFDFALHCIREKRIALRTVKTNSFIFMKYPRRLKCLCSCNVYITVMFTCGWVLPARWPTRPILGFWGSKVLQNGRFPALDADEPPCKMWRC